MADAIAAVDVFQHEDMRVRQYKRDTKALFEQAVDWLAVDDWDNAEPLLRRCAELAEERQLVDPALNKMLSGQAQAFLDDGIIA